MSLLMTLRWIIYRNTTMTNKNIITTIILFFLCAYYGYSQSRIERLLPLLIDCDKINSIENIEKKIEGDSISINYILIGLPTPIEMVSQSVKDSLIAAFEYEYVIATESDRYHKRGKSGDTLSYALIYYDTEFNNITGKKLNATDYGIAGLDVNAVANLDFKGNNMMFDYYIEGIPRHRAQLENTIIKQKSEEETIAMLVGVFKEIAENNSIIKKAIVFDGSKNTSGYCLFQTNCHGKSRSKGVRLEVPPSLAEETYKKMADTINIITVTNQCFSFSQSKNNIDIVFGKEESGDAFLLHRAADGRVFIFHKEKQENGYDNYLPRNWYAEDYVEQ